MECFDLIHPCLNFLLTNQLISVDSGGRVLGGHRKMKQPGCKADTRMAKLDSAAGIRKGGLWSACFRCKGMTDKVIRFFRF